jgi:alanine-synthesizing transaminase
VFSRRLPWDLDPNPLSTLLAEKRAANAPVLDLTNANPTRAAIDYPRDLLAPLADPAGLRYDPHPLGIESARRAIADTHGGVLAPNQIVLTASTSEAYSHLFKLLCNPGDEVLAPRPSYPLFDFLAGLCDVRMRHYALRYDGAWHIDFASLEASLTQKSRAIVVVNPNNPTGSFLKHEEWDHLQTFAARADLAIISDEVFRDYAFAADPRRVPTAVGSPQVLTFGLNGLSKMAALPQLKLGWIAVTGPASERALAALELIADTYLSVATPIQLALPHLLAQSATMRAAIVDRTAANLRTLQSALVASPATVLNVEGGWSAVIQVPRTISEQAWVLRLLSDCDVLVQPGFYFDFEQEAFLVASLLTTPDAFGEGVRRLRSIL